MINHIAVIGAGQMGRGIAQVCALAGYHVQVIDLSAEQRAQAEESIATLLQHQVSKGMITPKEQEKTISHIQFFERVENPKTIDLVIEAVSENSPLKAKIFQNLDVTLKDTAILASNTSSLSITKLAAATQRPDRVIGMHFMNPAPLMPLVEVIRGLKTSDATYAAIETLIGKLGKTSVVAKDSPGFIVNRILMPMINEAIYAVYEGVASPNDIDTAMKLGTCQPMGPLALADFIGLDTCLAIMQTLHKGLGDDKYRPCPLLVNYVAAGRWGKKTGQGFYEY